MYEAGVIAPALQPFFTHSAFEPQERPEGQGAAPRILDSRTFAAAMPKPSDSERLCVAAAKDLASLEM